MNDSIFITFLLTAVALLFIGGFFYCHHERRLQDIERQGDDRSNRSVLLSIERFVKIIAIAAVLFCTGVAIHYCCVFFPRYISDDANKAYYENFGVDYWGIVVGFMALLVTLLVGWQIFNTIQERDRNERLEKRYNDFKNKMITSQNELEQRMKGMEVCCNERKEEIKGINKKIDTDTDNLRQQIDNNLKESRMYAESLYELEEARTQLAVFQLYNLLRTNLGLLNLEIPERNNMLDKSLFGVSKSLSALKNSNQRYNDKSRTYSLLVTLIGNIKDYGQLKYISSSTFSSIIDEVTDDKLSNTIRSKDELIQELNELKTKSEKLQEEQDREEK